VIQLREARSGKQVAFDEARATLAEEQAAGDRERGFNELIGKLVDQVYRNPGSLAPAAAEAGLPVQTAGPFSRGEGNGVAAHPAVQRAAFSEALVQDGTASDPIELEPNRSVLIRVTDHQPEHALPLAQVRERVVAAIRADRAARALEQDAEAMVVRVRGGDPLRVVAGTRGVEVQDVPGMPRGAPVPDAQASEAYFQAPAPVDGTPSAGKVRLADGGFVVFSVTAVTPGDPARASPQEREMLGQQLAQLIGNEDASALLRALRQQMKITVVEARL
jgi:peptidyl-prolyl cis-trans isomerase D